MKTLTKYALIDDDGVIMDYYFTPHEALNDMIFQYGEYHKVHGFKIISIDEYELFLDDLRLTIKNIK